MDGITAIKLIKSAVSNENYTDVQIVLCSAG